MKKEFLSGAFFSVALNLVVKTIWILGIELAVQRAVGTEQYGMYFSLFNYSMLFLILLDLGITNYNNRDVARNANKLHHHFTTILVFKLLLGLLYTLVLLAGATLLGYPPERMQLLLYLAAAQFFASMVLYFRSNISALHHFKTDGLVAVADRGLLILLCGMLLWSQLAGQAFSILMFARLQCITSGLTLLLAFGINLRYTHFRLPRLRPYVVRNLLRRSMPFALLFLLMSAYTRIDPVLLDAWRSDGEKQAGIYAAAFRLFDAYSQITYIFTGMLLPIFARQLKRREDSAPVLSTALSILLFSATAISLVSLGYGGWMADLLYKENTEATGQVLSILLCASVPFVISMTMGALLTAANRLRLLNGVALACLGLNLSLNAWLVPRIGAAGSAITAVAVHSLSALILTWGVYKQLPVGASAKVFRQLALLVLINVPVCYAAVQFLPVVPGMALLALALLATGIALKLLPLAELKNLMMNRKS